MSGRVIFQRQHRKGSHKIGGDAQLRDKIAICCNFIPITDKGLLTKFVSTGRCVTGFYLKGMVMALDCPWQISFLF